LLRLRPFSRRMNRPRRGRSRLSSRPHRGSNG
jgi:hypothetical protein